MTGFVIIMALWLIAYIATLSLLVLLRRQFVIGGIALFAISLLPALYAIATTSLNSLGHPMAGIVLLPTYATALVSLVVIIVGLFRAARRSLRNRALTK